jgi:acetyl esterase/lipase
MTFSRRALALLAPLLGGCSPARLANALTPSSGYALRDALRYAPGPRGLLDLYEPKDAPATAPLVVFFYGGGWQSGERGDYRFAAEALTSLGYAVAIPDYTLMPGGAWPRFLQDGAAALRWVTDGPGAGRPLVTMGHSAGAFIALALATDPRWLGRARRDALSGAIGLAGPYAFQPEEPEYVATFAAAPGGRAMAAPDADADLARAPPVLLLHGLDDQTVSPERSRELAARLLRVGGRVDRVDYAGVGHVGIIAALAAPLRRVGLAAAPVQQDIARFMASLDPAAASGAA